MTTTATTILTTTAIKATTATDNDYSCDKSFKDNDYGYDKIKGNDYGYDKTGAKDNDYGDGR